MRGVDVVVDLGASGVGCRGHVMSLCRTLKRRRQATGVGTRRRAKRTLARYPSVDERPSPITAYACALGTPTRGRSPRHRDDVCGVSEIGLHSGERLSDSARRSDVGTGPPIRCTSAFRHSLFPDSGLSAPVPRPTRSTLPYLSVVLVQTHAGSAHEQRSDHNDRNSRNSRMPQSLGQNLLLPQDRGSPCRFGRQAAVHPRSTEPLRHKKISECGHVRSLRACSDIKIHVVQPIVPRIMLSGAPMSRQGQMEADVRRSVVCGQPSLASVVTLHCDCSWGFATCCFLGLQVRCSLSVVRSSGVSYRAEGS